MTQKQEKNFIDPATAATIGSFVFKSIAQAVVGWLGLEFFKNSLNRIKGNNEKPDTQGVSQEKPTEKT
jgi:hypothetical protein